MRKHNYEQPSLVTHSSTYDKPKTADEFREAMTWLKEHGFKGHFYDVPPEVIEEFEYEDVHITEGSDGFYFSIGDKNIISLWAPLELDELTPKLRTWIKVKFGMSPEEVVAALRKRSSDYLESLEKPFTKEEKETSFKVEIYPESMPYKPFNISDRRMIYYMKPSISAFHHLGDGVKKWTFVPMITINFHGKDRNVQPLQISASAPVMEGLVGELNQAIERNLAEIEKVKNG